MSYYLFFRQISFQICITLSPRNHNRPFEYSRFKVVWQKYELGIKISKLKTHHENIKRKAGRGRQFNNNKSDIKRNDKNALKRLFF